MEDNYCDPEGIELVVFKLLRVPESFETQSHTPSPGDIDIYHSYVLKSRNSRAFLLIFFGLEQGTSWMWATVT